ncbi:MAG: hypothetical protein QG652_639 [Pseudomonadota bacterium]|nr:hypothetical protein [Pseudomonadota bacterium]
MADNYSRIFLLSHMRAFTSLAGHILGSHPQINGYYEMHVSYDDAHSLNRQIDLYREHDELKPGGRYLFDKLLHNDYALQLERLNIPDVKILIALREPEHTIKSIVNLFAQKKIDDLYASPVEATRYYVDRLKWLADFCRHVDYRYFYFDAEMLKDESDILLPRLSQWLELDTPLSECYGVFSQTGKDRKGDSSENIRGGKINRMVHDYSAISIPDEQLKMARQVYRYSREAIIRGAAESVLLK